MLSRMNRLVVLVAITCLAGCGGTGVEKRVCRPARNVVIIGCDGLSVDGLDNANTPTLDMVMAQGAYTKKARAVMRTISGPNWASVLMGAGPEQHGVTSNKWSLEDYTIEPRVRDRDGLFPSIFSLMREQRPDWASGAVYDWPFIDRLIGNSSVDIEIKSDGRNTYEKGAEVLNSTKPRLMFLYFGAIDHIGHKYGWGSDEYYQAVEYVDENVGKFIDELCRLGLMDDTVIIIVSDHGGVGTKHGGESMDEIQVPWFIMGPGIAKGKELDWPVNVYDTAATAAYILGLKTPIEWEGRVVKDAFEQ